MAPKNKGKKSKKDDDDDFWEKAGTSVADNNIEKLGNISDEEENKFAKPSSGFSGFAALGLMDAGAAQEEEEEDFGGLMSTIKASQKNKKNNKKTTKKEDVEFDAVLAETKINIVETKPVDVPADDADDGEAGDDAGPKILSKKEKEKLKKERDKAKKKTQALAKKAETNGETVESTPDVLPPPPPPPQAVDEEKADDEEGEAGGKADSKKKKKKKAKKDEEPAAASTKKKTGGISALKAMMEEKKRRDEEERLKFEEERRRIEEEEKKAAEEEARKEAEKQRRKEKEKAKREQAKKEGRLLTPKQKKEKAAAELRKQLLLQASGIQIQGLQQPSDAPVTAKVSYGNKKKKGPASGPNVGTSTKDSTPVSTPTVHSIPLSPEPEPEPGEEAEPAKADDVLDDWEADSSEETTREPDVSAGAPKDSWDDSTDDEVAPRPDMEPAKQAEPVNASSKGKGKSSPTPVKPAPPTKVTNGKAQQAEEKEDEGSSSEEDSSSEEESDSDEDSDSEDEHLSRTQKIAAQKKAEAAERRARAREAALAAGSRDDLRSPICCILGHVDTGKTKLLDKIRQTNVQEGEAGGITQQIGATYFPVDAIKTKTAVLNKDNSQEYKIPGLLVIDTPGHESFTNLRTRGSSLCNIAILVVDIMHGLEPQTLESLRLLRDRKTPFIVALNKIDRMYGWDSTPDNDFRDSLAKQQRSVQREFEDRVQKTIVAFAEQGLNAVLYYDNKNFARNVSLVPTSALTGEGIPDMIMLLVNLTQQRMSDRLMYLSELECTVLEVKVIEGLGTTIDVVLSNGILREGDRIVVCGLNGPIVTQVRALLTPQPLRELRIKSTYVHHKEVKAALGVKLVAPDLEKAIAGSRLMVVGPDDDEEEMMEDIMSDLTSLLNSIDKSGRGVCVQASTLGSLEALLDFLKSSKIPVSGINIGPVHKKDVMRSATMLERAKELACILCFDVPVDKDAEKLAEEMGIRLFKADIIYHLFDAFTAYNADILEAKRKDAAPQAVWPCRLKIIAAFAKRDPIILGVDILDGTLRIGTPLCVVKVDPVTQKKEIIDLGKITSLEINHKTQDIVKKAQAGAGVAVKIEHAVYQSAKMFGRHFDDKDEIYSHITRQSIDVLKSSFKDNVTTEEWMLIKALKPRLNIQ